MQKTFAAHGAQAAPATSGTLPLALVSVGSTVQVVSVRGREDTRRHLEGLGFVEGSEVRVVSEIGGNLIVQAKGARIALDRQMALKIMIA